VRWLEAQGGKGAGAGPLGDHLKRMQALEALAKSRYQTGMATAADTAAAEYFRAEAELWVAEAQGGKP
jgi:outer membrane protein TolC